MAHQYALACGLQLLLLLCLAAEEAGQLLRGTCMNTQQQAWGQWRSRQTGRPAGRQASYGCRETGQQELHSADDVLSQGSSTLSWWAAPGFMWPCDRDPHPFTHEDQPGSTTGTAHTQLLLVMAAHARSKMHKQEGSQQRLPRRIHAACISC